MTEAMEAIELRDQDELRRRLLPRATADLWDLAEDVGRLLESSDDLDLTPACFDLLLTIDDALTSALHDERAPRPSPPSGRPRVAPTADAGGPRVP